MATPNIGVGSPFGKPPHRASPPKGWSISDRDAADERGFRFIDGDYSCRYRNRIRIERTFSRISNCSARTTRARPVERLFARDSRATSAIEFGSACSLWLVGAGRCDTKGQ